MELNQRKRSLTKVTLLYNLCRKLLSATLASSLQNETAALRLHALTEAMGLLSPVVVRLKSHFHSVYTSLTCVSSDFLFRIEARHQKFVSLSRQGLSLALGITVNYSLRHG